MITLYHVFKVITNKKAYLLLLVRTIPLMQSRPEDSRQIVCHHREDDTDCYRIKILM